MCSNVASALRSVLLRKKVVAAVLGADYYRMTKRGFEW